MKERTAARLGIRSDTTVLPENTPETGLLELLGQTQRRRQRARRARASTAACAHRRDKRISAVSTAKDVDGFHPLNAGKLMSGEGGGFVPCTPGGVHELLIRSGVTIEGGGGGDPRPGQHCRQTNGGDPLPKAKYANATVTLCHSRTHDVAEHCRRADIIVAAMGVAEFVKADMVKPGATVIDVGVNKVDDPAAEKGYRLVAMWTSPPCSRLPEKSPRTPVASAR